MSSSSAEHRDGRIATWPHEYDDLGDHGLMRHFQLWPGDFHDDFVISLSTTSIPDAPPYQAVSYVWGTTSKSQPVHVMEADNWNGFGTILVTPSLCAALRHIRKPDTATCLWADAICINQASTTERSHQVKHMADIYGNATEVLAWLGPDTWAKAKYAFSVLGITQYRERKEVLGEMEDQFVSNEYLSAWSWVTNQPWFKRVWTMQELGLSSDATMLCGHARVSWLGFYEICRLLDERFTFDVLRSVGIEHSSISFLYHWKTSRELSFLDTVAYAQHRSASDPRDKIFALSTHPGIASMREHDTSRRLRVNVDYQKTVAQVYTEAAVVMMKQTGTLDVLSYVRPEHLECHGLPSWSPDWHKKPTACLILTKLDSACGASNGPLNNAPPSFPSPGKLKTTGILCGKVIWQGRRGDIQSDQGLESLLKATATLPKDSTYWQLPEHQLRALETSLLRHLGWQHHGALPGSALVASEIKKDHEPTVKILEQLCTARSLFLTDTGLFGLGSEQLRKGDELYILNSGMVPYLLRPGQYDMYTLVGECYANGIMKGEIVFDSNAITREVILV